MTMPWGAQIPTAHEQEQLERSIPQQQSVNSNMWWHDIPEKLRRDKNNVAPYMRINHEDSLRATSQDWVPPWEK